MRVLITGAGGKMGRAIMTGIIDEGDIDVVGAVDMKSVGKDIATLIGGELRNIMVGADLEKAIRETKAEVVIDFTNPQAVGKNIAIALENGADMLVGTSGLSEEDMKSIADRAKTKGRKVFIAPNFALGAVLMMKFSQMAARYFPHVEIIEMHHDQKMDAPSGTAIKTLEMIAEERKIFSQGAPSEFEKINGCRGGDYEGMRVHSVRLPGYVAHQEVIFGGVGQTLVIRHDSINRESFVPGVLLALRGMETMAAGLIYGLDTLV